ncbi:peptidase inhibitor family I36 protein [Actinomadura fibrosa]|uniref:Peptidase inhibitor family I36 protein n=1 Tax=Actinomadura fibrosa TaxID=111802 RepID=A0ABW2X9Y5_9ACTN|nr:peptidase inhibitor family I36 protein [Actinomadura fibrosa]
MFVATAAAVAGLVPAAQADSAAPLPGCPANSVCGWSGPNFTGAVTIFRGGTTCTASTLPLGSVANTYPAGTGVPVTAFVYSGAFCAGTPVAVVGRGQAVPSLPSGARSVKIVV